MATLFVRHKVKDFESWKDAYDAFDEERKSLGVTGHGAYQGESDRNEVTVYHHFESMEAAKEFSSGARLKAVMRSAGVEGEPDLWFGDRV